MYKRRCWLTNTQTKPKAFIGDLKEKQKAENQENFWFVFFLLNNIWQNNNAFCPHTKFFKWRTLKVINSLESIRSCVSVSIENLKNLNLFSLPAGLRLKGDAFVFVYSGLCLNGNFGIKKKKKLKNVASLLI